MLASNPMWHEADHQRLQAQNLPMVGAWANRPGSPSAGQRYSSTDHAPDGRAMDFAWGGALGVWLSTQLFQVQFIRQNAAVTYTATTADINGTGGVFNSNSICVVGFNVAGSVATTFDSTNTWTIDINRQDSAGAFANIFSSTIWATGRVAGTAYNFQIAPGAGVILSPSQVNRFYMTVNKVASAGNLTLQPGAVLYYRVVAS